jgi:hypothetical protein
VHRVRREQQPGLLLVEDEVPCGVARSVQDAEPARTQLDLLASRKREVDVSGSAVQRAHPGFGLVGEAELVLGLVSAVPVGHEPLRIGHEAAVGEAARGERLWKLLLEARETALVVEVGVRHDHEAHGVGRETDVSNGREDRVARRFGRPRVDEQRRLVAHDQILEQVAWADERLDPPGPVGDLGDAHPARHGVGSATWREPIREGAG